MVDEPESVREHLARELRPADAVETAAVEFLADSKYAEEISAMLKRLWLHAAEVGRREVEEELGIRRASHKP